MRRVFLTCGGAVTALILAASPVLACGGLVAPNGSVNLVRTTTLAAYKDGVEHYVTSFEFNGAAKGKFGSIVPLPDVPTEVQRGGRWTLQRLVQEVQPPVLFDAFALEAAGAVRSAKVLLETRVGALDITVLKGGGDEVGNWARKNGFFLPPDAPEVLDFYARRSPIFMAARFDLQRARQDELQAGDGVAVHLTIPTDRPWVPLRILGLGRGADEIVEADVFLLTANQPDMLPAAEPAGSDEGMILERSERASRLLLTDLNSDRGMEWLPDKGMWLSYLRLNLPAGELTHDLALNTSGGIPSRIDAGLEMPRFDPIPRDGAVWWPWLLTPIVAAGALWASNRIATARQ
jgi:Uncharacterized protein conserved in bacteria (DUF2330)